MIIDPGPAHRASAVDLPSLSRRRFLHGATGAAAGVTAASVLGLPALAHADEAEFARLRAWWVDFLTGGPQDLADPAVAAVIKDRDDAADQLLALVDPDPNRTSVFTDLPYDPDDPESSRRTATSGSRLRELGTTWATAGSRHHGSEPVLETIKAGAHTILSHNYRDGLAENGNWFNYEIALPQYLGGVFAILGDAADPDDLAAYAAAIDFYVPDPRYNYPPNDPRHKLSTGANRVDLCEGVIVRGFNARSAAKITDAAAALQDVMVYSTKGDGFYRDGGFIQHVSQPYTGTYGSGLLRDLSVLLALLAGSAWEVTGPGVELIFDTVENCYAPVVYDNQAFSHICGRATSRRNRVEHGPGLDIAEGILTLADAVPADRARAWRERCLGWFRRATFADPLATSNLRRLALFRSVLDDPALTPAPEPVEHRIIPSMARAIHRSTDWAFTIAMCRTGVAAYEAMSTGENRRGWYQGRGMNYLYLPGDNAQFSDAFWPTVDPMRLPGVTVERRPLPEMWERGTTASFAGGASADGFRAVIGQKIVGPGEGSAMRGNKSWFCLDDAVVALGSGIVGDGSYPIETIMENRNLFESGTNPLIIDGVRQPSDQGWTARVGRPGWVHLAGVGGYVLLDSLAGQEPELVALREERTGTWLDINTYWSGHDDTPYTRRYLTLYLDHGPDPDQGSYAYLLLPGAGAAKTERRHRDPEVRLLAQSTYTHALYAPRFGFTGVNFFGIPDPAEHVELAGELEGAVLTASKLCTVAITARGRSVRIGVANPAHNIDAFTVQLAGLGLRPESADPSVEVTRSGSTITLAIDASDRDGRTHHAKLIKEG
ncbi:polysaccharide lyase 8 family protein [Microlunatus parietis]|uniref:Hyaluronate lyase n=1 Tax=Microlunatus parietis TaxID=682979 RepID=A0A7Y9I407_9ACTN|nr:polysaccharide lyase 8 family protein [Microlunatus parietis]NYE69875.1 hyaluronate lyase [Microlunatus parietis]